MEFGIYCASNLNNMEFYKQKLLKNNFKIYIDYTLCNQYIITILELNDLLKLSEIVNSQITLSNWKHRNMNSICICDD